MKLSAMVVQAGTLKISAYLNDVHALEWFIPLDKFQSEKILFIQEVL